MNLFAAAIVAYGLLSQGADTVSDELIHLDGLKGDQVRMVDAARRFHLQQQALMDWDRALLADYSRREQHELVDAKRSDIRHRVAIIRETWEIVLGYYPYNPRAVNYFGEYLYDHERKYEEAVQHWMVAIRLDDDLDPAYNNLGLHYFHTGKILKGLKSLEKALKLDSKNPDYLFNMAQMYLIYFPDIEKERGLSRSRIYRDAMRFSRDAARYAPDDFEVVEDYAVNFFAAQNFGVKADWEAAAHAWEAARALARTESELYFTWLNEGRAWIQSEDFDKALESLTQAQRLLPEREAVRALLEQIPTQQRGS